MPFSKKQDEQDYGNPFVDRSGRFPVDQFLRECGFQIYERKRDKEPIWIRNKKKYQQIDAERRIPANKLADLELENFFTAEVDLLD